MTKMFQLKISLNEITPSIWRRFIVKDSICFQDLHQIIQTVMGWKNSHMFEFQIDDVNITNEEEHSLAEKNKPKNKYTLKSKISELFSKKKQPFRYVYDFGDNWEHTIIVENILDEKDVKEYPICLAGERACPPEDCGSVPGYYELMEIKKNKKHPEYEEMIVEWLGKNFDFEKFDVSRINKELQKQNNKVDGRTRYWVPT